MPVHAEEQKKVEMFGALNYGAPQSYHGFGRSDSNFKELKKGPGNNHIM